jgi:hypothetical protein
MEIPKMILIGATNRNLGKTTITVNIIKWFLEKKFDAKIYGIKGTVLKDKKSKNGFTVLEELNSNKDKDTSRMLKAGCEKVFWLKCDEEHVKPGLENIMDSIPENSFVICESNTVRKYVKPSLFLMVERSGETSVKPSSTKVKKQVDFLIDSKIKNGVLCYEPQVLEFLTIENGRWVLKR